MREATLKHDWRYPGGKNADGVWQWIVAHIPPHARYCEPFAGSAAILRRKTPAIESLLVELDDAQHARLVRAFAPRPGDLLAGSGVRVLHGCGIRWLEEQADYLGPDDCVYCDPPYLMATRSYGRVYRREMTDCDHQRILAAIYQCDARVLISGYASPMYSSRLASWYRTSMRVMSRGGIRTEILWCNFQPAAVGTAEVIAGRTWRERERIGRKVRRWRSNYAQLPRPERRAIIATLLSAEYELRARASPHAPMIDRFSTFRYVQDGSIFKPEREGQRCQE